MHVIYVGRWAAWINIWLAYLYQTCSSVHTPLVYVCTWCKTHVCGLSMSNILLIGLSCRQLLAVISPFRLPYSDTNWGCRSPLRLASYGCVTPDFDDEQGGCWLQLSRDHKYRPSHTGVLGLGSVTINCPGSLPCIMGWSEGEADIFWN